ncbi:methyl-accepting chemotaxis protein [Sphingomonas sp. ID0503]|uniref:cache domain-containing protein n=1 Tax=Sphingomonas sp. ID0503 TaxID=3399691 RepID=UPI003AFA405C
MQDDLLKLFYEVTRITEDKVGRIDGVMRQAGVLALNARLEAARAGTAGTAFSVVAQEMSAIAQEIRGIGSELRDAIAGNVALLETAGAEMVLDFRGERYADLARSAVEIIDRNLYERSCDVRWWATDSAVVNAAEEATPESCAHASDRLATILRSYTVYLDLWVADRNGRVIATGRPDRYRHAIGMDVSSSEWFRRAMALDSGDDFHVCDIGTEAALDGAAVATYSTAVRQGGDTHGERIGALGIFFDWAPQARAVLAGIGLSREEREDARLLILDRSMKVIAASDDRGFLTETFGLETADCRRGHYRNGDRLVAFAETPGYETYKGLGWIGCIESRSTQTNAPQLRAAA